MRIFGASLIVAAIVLHVLLVKWQGTNIPRPLPRFGSGYVPYTAGEILMLIAGLVLPILMVGGGAALLFRKR